MARDPMIQDLYQSIQDDLVTVESLVTDLQMSDLELFHFNAILTILNQLKREDVPELMEFRKISRQLENQLLMIRRDGLAESNLSELLRYIKRLDQYLNSLEALYFQDPEKSLVEQKPVLVVEKSDVLRKMIIGGLPEGCIVECEADGIHALDRYIHMQYDIVIIASGMTGMDGRSFLRAIQVIESVNKQVIKVFISSGSELDLAPEYCPDHHIVRDQQITDKIRSLLSD